MKNKLFLIAMLIGFTGTLSAQQVRVTHVSVTSNDKIEVAYTINGLKNYQEISNIRFYVSRDGGDHFEGPLKEVSGDIQSGLRNGKYIMIWDVMEEMPLVEENLIFDVRITVEEKKALMISLQGNMVTPLGLRIGQLGKLGWYVEGRASLLATQSPSFTYENEKIIDYDQPGYYKFNGNKGYNAWSAVAGLTWQLSWNLFVNAGVGYGVENYMYEINNYSYDTEEKTGNSWVKDSEYSTSGIEVDAGLIFKYKKLIVNAGVTSIGFNIFNWEAGIGIAF
jgi:hypothetical protein